MNFISEQPWYYLLLCFPAGLLYAWFLYRNEKAKGNFKPALLYFLFSLRFLVVFIISLLLLNLLLKRNINETEKPTIVFAFDNSVSVVSAKDSSEIKNAFIKELEKIKSDLSNKYNIRSLIFGSKVETDKPIDFNDKETDLSELMNAVDNNFSNLNVGALVICSDGIINRGGVSAGISEKLKFPVYCIALGDTSVKKDGLIQKINHNQVVYLGNKFPVEVTIRNLKLKGNEVSVSISKDGTKKTEQKIKISSDNFIQSMNFVLEAEKPGVQKYRVALTVLPEEITGINNYRDFVVDVIDTREKILILAAAPHPDIAALKESLEATQTYEVESANASEFNKPLKPYSLVILHSLSLNNLPLLTELKNNNQPYFILLPKTNEGLPGMRITSAYNKQNETEALYNKNFTLFNISDELKNFIRQFPAVNTHFGTYAVSPGANALIFQKIGMVDTENPILLFNEQNGIKTGVFTGDGLWRWRLRDYSEHKNQNLFNELISKSVQYLSVKADKSFFRLTTKKIINENENIEFTAEVYNKSYQLVNEPDVNLIITDSAGKQFTYVMSKNESGYFLNCGLLPPGEYKYKASVKYNEQVFGQNGTITVNAIVSEKMNTVANHALLYQIAIQSGGKLFYKNETELLKKELLDNEMIKPITFTQKQLSDLIDLKWIFYLIIGLLSIEWFLRKRNGSI